MPIRNPHLRRFWLTFSDGKWSRYVGVTAYDLEEALALARNLFRGPHWPALPDLVAVIEDVDLPTLDPNHVILNCDAPVWHGIWHPIGCRDSSY